MAKKSKLAKSGEEGYFERNTETAQAAHRVFETAEEFEETAAGYFDECDRRNELYGEAGLCLYLSKHNRKGKSVSLSALRSWYDGKYNMVLQDAVQQAYLRIQNQIEADARYREKGMSPRAIFLQKQPRFGGYQDRIESSQEATVRIIHGNNMDESDFK